VDSPEHEHRQIVGYVLSQSPDGVEVVNAEKVSSESVWGRRHDVWDVHCSDGRWWVVTNPTNLYTQDQFPSMDVALSFHLGLAARMASRESRQAPDGQRQMFAEAWRRWEHAGGSIEAAFEAEDYQAVGVRCREALIAFVSDAQGSLENRGGTEAPKSADFVDWTEILARTLARGASSERVRGYLKAISRSTWQLVNWVTHEQNASRADAELAFEATRNVLSAFCTAVLRAELEQRCPECSWSRLADVYDPGGETATTLCVACGYRSEPYELEQDDRPRRDPDQPADVEGDCVIVEKPLYGPKLSDV